MQHTIISIAIVDDHTLFRSGLASLLEEFDEIDIKFQAVNGVELQQKLVHHPDIDLILMDINMPLMDGFAATKWVKEKYPKINVLALSMLEDEKAIIGMLRAGCGGYMLKESTPNELLTAIKTVSEKGFFVNDLVSGRLLVALKDNNAGPAFSDRERTFLQHCSTDKTYREIADMMNVSPRTVDNYRESLFAKLNVKSRTGLVVYGIKNDLIVI